MLLDTYSSPAGSVSTTCPKVTPEGVIVTVNSSPAVTDDRETSLLALGAPSCAGRGVAVGVGVGVGVPSTVGAVTSIEVVPTSPVGGDPLKERQVPENEYVPGSVSGKALTSYSKLGGESNRVKVTV